MTDAFVTVLLERNVERHPVTDDEYGAVTYSLTARQLFFELLPNRGKFVWYAQWQGALFAWTGSNQRRSPLPPLVPARFDTIPEAAQWLLDRSPSEVVRMLSRRGNGTHVSDNPRLEGRIPVLGASVDKDYRVRIRREKGTPTEYELPKTEVTA